MSFRRLIKKFYRNNIFYVLFFASFTLLSLFIYRSLLFNFSTNLLDWNDYPLFVWIMQHNIEHFRSLTFSNFFDTNIFYPFKGNLLFSDLFLPTSLVGFLVQIFTKNPITVFNSVFFLVLIVNPVACFFFWKNFFTSKWLLFFATLITAFSPFVIINAYHFQMLNIWPMFFCLGFLLKKELSLKNAILGGAFLAIQFLTGVYYAVFIIFILVIWYLFKFWEVKKSRIEMFNLFRNLPVCFFVFFILSGFFVMKYMQVAKAYSIVRAYWEYVIYAASPTDYIFLPYKSLLAETGFFQRWNSFNAHGSAAGFPGFVLLILSLLGIFGYQTIHKIKSISLKLTNQTLFFFILLICGFVFSLGPRLSVNGVYLAIPLPYSLFLKLVPLFEPIRADSRWAFLVYLSLAYFACLGIQKLTKMFRKEAIIILGLSLLYVVEIVPTNRNTESKQYYNAVYDTVKTVCLTRPSVLLEYPLTQDKKDANIVTNLSYKTQMLLASTQHKCNIVNGYSGFTPVDYERYETELYTVVPVGGKDRFYQLLKQRDVDLFKLNKKEIYQDKSESIENWLKDEKKYVILTNNETFVIAKIL